jgi:hypothetical protein
MTPRRGTIEISVSGAIYNMAVKLSHALFMVAALALLVRPVNVPTKIYRGSDAARCAIITCCQKLLWLPEAPRKHAALGETPQWQQR